MPATALQRRSRRPTTDLRKPPRGYVTPSSWTVQHVGYCLVRAFLTLRQTPGRIGPRGVGSSWPSSPSWNSLYDLIEAVRAADGRSDAAAIERPTAEAVRQMDQALQWAAEHLIDGSDLAAERSALVQATAKALAYGIDMEAIAERRKLPAAVLLGQYRHGLNAIALRLQAAHVPVWALD